MQHYGKPFLLMHMNDEWRKTHTQFNDNDTLLTLLLRSKKAIFGNDHEEVSNAMYSLAIALDSVGNYALSIQYYKEVSSTSLLLVNNIHNI